MPTAIVVPTNQRVKSVQYGAAYSPALTFNPDKLLFYQMSGVLTGMNLSINTVPTPNQVTVGPGAFIQRGIIVDIQASQLVEAPNPLAFPLYLTAENQNEVFGSNVTLQFTMAPAADSVILASWTGPTLASPVIPQKISIKEIVATLNSVPTLIIRREHQVAAGGQVIFTLNPLDAYVVGTNKLSVHRNGKKLEVNIDYTEISPTSIQLAAGALVGDFFEFMMIQSAPPVGSFSLYTLTDVTQDLGDGIRDLNGLRVSPTTALNPLATFADVAAAVAAGAVPTVTNYISTARQVSGKTDFFNLTGGFGVDLVASALDPFVAYVHGIRIALTANQSFLVSNGNNFIWIDSAGLVGISSLPVTTSFTAPGGPTVDQHWFDLAHNQMFRWNGASWAAVNRIFIGYIRCDGGVVNARYSCEPINLSPIARFRQLGNGSEGFLELIAGTTVIDGFHQYSAVVIRGTAIVKHTGLSNVPMELRSQGVIAVLDTAMIDLNGLGFPGGPSFVGAQGNPGTGGGTGGGGGAGGALFNSTAGGAGGGHPTPMSPLLVGGGVGAVNSAGGPGAPSAFVTINPARFIAFGYGNGGGAGSGGINFGPGSPGGGYLALFAATIVVGAGAIIRAEGLQGIQGFGNQGAGGGGGGGIIQLFALIVYNSGTISVNGGLGGIQLTGNGRPGGAGGLGALTIGTIFLD